MLNKSVVLRVCILAVWPLMARGDVFEWVDGQGRHHYSDRKQANAKILTVEPGVSYHRVEKVFDGDTILLSNGQKVRLLGVNTPEIAGRNKNAEPGGEQAKTWLRQRIEHKKVRLEGDVEKQDKYQRSLAYVFAEDKQHINLELVRLGLAAVNIYPPNLKYVDALLEAQKSAEQAERGLWGLQAYAAQPFIDLNEENYKGWKRVTGRIRALKLTAKYSYLQFSDHVSVRIENQNRSLFPSLQSYVGQSIEARGWVAKSKDRFAVQVRHPGDIRYLQE
ncbi:thermonuclease family protein [Methylomonas methanica]|uniref:Nuclease (SNase domain-containing protein) n=1 Tax=Methylomonas methanica (strain DSM 25384 / MC09) TaxID=857087 RepID=F9ZYH7_METMM|nr:thermonuclease family protein [Methylomonas methanica]AEG02249.1 nuclease (SNase domain-containing protein) [Methylomonas methanica MC09]